MDAPRFCTECGAALPAGARFCAQCGAQVRAAAQPLVPPPPAAAPACSAAGERREVVVMFADLAGYTHLTSQLDAEEVHRLLGRYFAIVDGIVASHGGTIDKHIGDAVMAVFGAPVAHDNDAERAVRAACGIHAALARLGDELGARLAAHIGLAGGEVVAAGTGSAEHTAYTVTGDAVNLASRLESMAKGGETLVSASVWNAVAGFCDGDAAGALAVKGLDAPVEAWRVRRCRATTSVTPPLVGREDELRQFDAALASVAAKRTGRLLLLRGEAGIGKTRLVEACVERARAAGFACHAALVLDFGVARGRGAIAALVAGLLGAPGTESDERRSALAAALDAGRIAADDEAALADLCELPLPPHLKPTYEAMEPAARSRARQSALATLVATQAAQTPRLLVVEDLHWADALTLEGLAALARACAASPALLLATTRIEGDPIDARWRAAAGLLPQLTLDLDRLRPEESIQLAHALAGGDERRVLECIQRAEGNPLFLVQLLRDTGGGAAVPGSIRSLVLSRIDRLTPRDRDAVQAAAVIGQRFGLPLLRELTGAGDYRCDALVEHFLVRPEGDEYLFAHALICEGAYASLLHSRKRELHARAAQWYTGKDAALCAQHLDRAGDPGAAAAYVAAAHDQAAMLRFDRALALAERAVALAQDPAVRHTAAMLRAELLRDAGRTTEAIAAFEAAAADAPDDASRCRALIGVASGHRLAGAPDDVLATLALAQPLAGAPGLQHETSVMHYLRGNLHFARGEVEACRREHAAALFAARAAGDAQDEANALSGLGDAAYAGGLMRTALDRFTEAVALARMHTLPRIESANLCMVGHCSGFLCEWDVALARIEEAVHIARRLALPHGEVFARESIAIIRLQRGERDEAAREAMAALDLARAVGSRRYVAILLWILGEIAIGAGDLDVARAHHAEVRAIMEAQGIGGFIGALLCSGEAQVATDRAAALRSLAEGEAWLARGSLAHCHLWFRTDAIDVALALGDDELALHHCDAIEAYAAAEPLPWSDFHAARGRAIVAHRRDPAMAGPVLRSLRERALELGFRAALPSIDVALSR